MRYFEDPDSNEPKSKYPCGICSKNVNKEHRSIQCSLCNYHVHIKCNKIDPNSYSTLRNSDKHFICITCIEDTLPFQHLSNPQFIATSSKGIDKGIDYNDLRHSTP